MKLFDAHNHLHDVRLEGAREEALRVLEAWPIARAVVNGTQESDWPAVERLGRAKEWVKESYGLHPWYLAGRGADWLEKLQEVLERRPEAAVGEVGLDRWIRGHDLTTQMEVLGAQWWLARELERPVTVHCLRAWGALADCLQDWKPVRGFLLHSYGGPVEMVAEFAKHGAYFSFSPYFLHQRKTAAREVFRHIPPERLLVETDAPDMAPPPEHDGYGLHDAKGERLNHPGNLRVTYEGLAALRGWPVEELAGIVEKNWQRLFG